MINDSQQFEDYHEIVIKFMTDLFRNRNTKKDRPFFWHTTVAVENNVVGEVFTDVQAALVARKLESMGFAKLSFEQNSSNNDRPNLGSSALKAPSATASVVKNNNDPVIMPPQNNNA